jgi:hypothetical protein
MPTTVFNAESLFLQVGPSIVLVSFPWWPVIASSAIKVVGKPHTEAVANAAIRSVLGVSWCTTTIQAYTNDGTMLKLVDLRIVAVTERYVCQARRRCCNVEDKG